MSNQGWIIRAADANDGHLLWRRVDPPSWATIPSGATVFASAREADQVVRDLPDLDLTDFVVEPFGEADEQ
jgi:hypothetical protein